ncbi:hypothetical protein PInf_002681 [Phytophthora infestans]|nr:hypothetical protein PInf_002582 [Phytophthora infestans]KAI9998301.1 hypothetical protein PInf_002681 [Phytophthora infestans]
MTYLLEAFAIGDWGTTVSTDSRCTRSETCENFDIVAEDVAFRLMNTQVGNADVKPKAILITFHRMSSLDYGHADYICSRVTVAKYSNLNKLITALENKLNWHQVYTSPSDHWVLKDHVYVCTTEAKDSSGVSIDIISFDSGDSDVHAAQQVCCPCGYSEGGADFCVGGDTDYDTCIATVTQIWQSGTNRYDLAWSKWGLNKSFRLIGH